jgi:hypothetical protein
MGRANVIAGLVDQLRLISGFDSLSNGTVVAYDERVLTSGVERAVVVLADRSEGVRVAGRPGAGQKMADYTWRIAANLYIRDSGDVAQDRLDIDTYSGTIIQRVLSNPTLGGSAIDALVTAGQISDEIVQYEGAAPYYLEVLTVSALERLTG